MKYFVPSWHLDISDWASTQQIITFDDAIGNMRIMNHADEDYGLIIGDYKPQLITQLNAEGVAPTDTLAAFDWIQDTALTTAESWISRTLTGLRELILSMDRSV